MSSATKQKAEVRKERSMILQKEMAGKLFKDLSTARETGKKVVYHVHETSIKPKSFKSFLRFIIQQTATKVIFVSDFLYKEDAFKNINQFVVHNAIDSNFFDEVIYKIPSMISELEEKITPHLSRSYSDIDPIEKGILLLGCYELIHRPDIPYRVAINEAIELAKTFGAEDAHKFINGVLDKVALIEGEGLPL